MALTSQQIDTLQRNLQDQKEKLEGVLVSLQNGGPAASVDRVNDNADTGTDAIESESLVEYESLQRETEVLLQRVNDALSRMDDGSYGTTPEGEEIPYERLLIDPTVTTVVHA